METTILITLCAMLAVSCYHDIRYRRIPNWLTFPGMLLGLIFHVLLGGLEGGLQGLGGLALGMALLMPFYAMGVMGAGDVKLMGAVGAFLGLKGGFYALLIAGILGGLHAVLLLSFHPRQALNVVRNFWSSLKLLVLARGVYLPTPEKNLPKLPYGVDIALGGMGYAIWTHLGYSSWSQFVVSISSSLS